MKTLEIHKYLIINRNLWFLITMNIVSCAKGSKELNKSRSNKTYCSYNFLSCKTLCILTAFINFLNEKF